MASIKKIYLQKQLSLNQTSVDRKWSFSIDKFLSTDQSIKIVRFVSATTKSFQKKKKRPLITTRTPICHAKKGKR